MTPEYERLVAFAKRPALLDSAASVLGWDQETMMPPRGVEPRAEQLAELARLSHELATSAEFGDLLAAAEARRGDVPPEARTNLAEWRRSYDRSVRLPADLVSAFAAATSRAQHEWAGARQDSSFARFAPRLRELIQLARRRAACLGVPADGEPWDALAEDFEPGLRAADLVPLFSELRPRLVALRRELKEAPSQPSADFARLPLDPDRQEAFVREVAEALGFDFGAGRLDRSAHPFTCGFHPHDVRITTRFAEADVLDALGSTMHEVGHGLYEQGLPAEDAGTPLGQSVSLGIHESQSRLWENHVGRSRPFWEWCWGVAERHFGPAVRDYDAVSVWRCANRVAPGLIRVEADELTYDLHIMVRFELERALIRGDLEVDELPDRWNRAYADYLGIEVPDDARGCLQDVHWSAGLFGYFPTYTLGNLYAAQFFAAARRALPDLDDDFAAGRFAPLREWLRSAIHAAGRRRSAAELIEAVTGGPLATEPFLTGLRARVGAAHDLA